MLPPVGGRLEISALSRSIGGLLVLATGTLVSDRVKIVGPTIDRFGFTIANCCAPIRLANTSLRSTTDKPESNPGQLVLLGRYWHRGSLPSGTAPCGGQPHVLLFGSSPVHMAKRPLVQGRPCAESMIVLTHPQ